MSFYFDTNVVVSLFFEDAHSSRIGIWINQSPRPMAVSAWLEIEFYALINRRVRAGVMTPDVASARLARFENFILLRSERLALSPAAGARAAELACDPSLKLSAADALHLALSSEGSHCLVTFDARLIEAAKARGYDFEAP